MIQLLHFRNDIRQILRDPIMVILMLAPLMLIVVFKLLVILLIPFVFTQTGFDVLPYSHYILAFVLLISSGMLGIVTGFMLMDERDGNIAELMSVTPLGRSGYLINRLLFASILSGIYCIAICYGLNTVKLPLFSIVILSLLSAIYSAITGLMIFTGADDKVKGLTFAKALNSLVLFAFTDLFMLRWLIILSWFFPPYWFAMIIKSPHSLLANGLGLVVHIAWLWLLIIRYWRKE